MDDLREQLTKDDPIAYEPLPDRHEFDRMRRTIVAAADEAAARAPGWPRPVWFAASIAVVGIMLGIGRAARIQEPAGGAAPRSEVAAPQAASRRQLQFVTPGGTRVIWILNEEFDEWSQR